VLYITIFLLVWYVAADRLAPWTEQARIQTYVIPIVSQVSSRVVEVNVEKDAVVQPGDILFKIDPADYELSVENALDVAPGKIFSGTVSSIGFAVDSSTTGTAGELAKLEGKSGWLREAQRFPVIITRFFYGTPWLIF
jgi:multidrug resistance efflux pump